MTTTNRNAKSKPVGVQWETHLFVCAIILTTAVWAGWHYWLTGAFIWERLAVAADSVATPPGGPASAPWALPLEQAGQLGDLFGGVTALFTAWAFAGVVWAGLLQRRDIAIQAQELADTREVLERQQEVITIQQFESIFFQMLRLSREARDRLEAFRTFEDETGEEHYTRLEGHEAAEHLAESIFKRTRRRPRASLTDDQLLGVAMKGYSDVFWAQHSAEGAPYFRCLYHVVKLIDRSAIADHTKGQYANMVRAQLADGEVLLLALNGLTELGAEFKPLIEHYGLLKHMSADHLETLRPALLLQYLPDAFAGSEVRKLLEAERAGKVRFQRTKA